MENRVNSVGAESPLEMPSWLSAPDPAPIAPSKEGKALLFIQFESVFQRVMEAVSGGSTLTNALKDLPIELDPGAFYRWVRKDHNRFEQYKEAKELRTESWAGKLVEYAEAADSMEDVNRSKLKVDTLKWLMAADNRRTYGDTKQIEIGGSISITAALSAAQQRVTQVIESEVVDVTPRLESE